MNRMKSFVASIVIAVFSFHAATPAIAGVRLGLDGKEQQEKQQQAFMQQYLWEINRDGPVYSSSGIDFEALATHSTLKEVEQYLIANSTEVRPEVIKSFISTDSSETAYTFSLKSKELPRLMLEGDARERANNTASVITGISAANQINRTFDLTENSPVIWARYYPNRRMGYIQIFQIRKKAYSPSLNINQRLNSPDMATRNAALSEMVEIQHTILGPELGVTLARGNDIKRPYNGVNPFQPFINSSYPSRYVNMSLGAFQAAVGVWAAYYSTTRGYLAVADVNVQQHSWSVRRGMFRREFHTEATATVRPIWYAMTAFDNASGRPIAAGYISEPCRQSGGTEEQCLVLSPVGFIEISRFADVPHEPFRFWHQHQSRRGWTLFFFMVLIAIVSFAFPPLAIAGGSSWLSAGILMVGYGAVSIILNGGGSIGDLQSGLFGRLSNGYEVGSSGGDPNWNPDYCGTTGSRSPGTLLRDSGGRHGNYECINWLSGNIENLPGAVGAFFNERSPNVIRDFANPNDIENMRNKNTRPRAFDGAPIRQ